MLVIVEEVGVCTGPGQVVFFWVVVVRSGPQFVGMPPVGEFDFFERELAGMGMFSGSGEGGLDGLAGSGAWISDSVSDGGGSSP